jgi:hypothetical protein
MGMAGQPSGMYANYGFVPAKGNQVGTHIVMIRLMLRRLTKNHTSDQKKVA